MKKRYISIPLGISDNSQILTVAASDIEAVSTPTRGNIISFDIVIKGVKFTASFDEVDWEFPDYSMRAYVCLLVEHITVEMMDGSRFVNDFSDVEFLLDKMQTIKQEEEGDDDDDF